MNPALLLAALLTLPLAASAQPAAPPAAEDYAWHLRLDTPGTHAFYQFELPLDVLRGLRGADGGDLALFDHRGQPVAFALLDAPEPARQTSTAWLPLLPHLDTPALVAPTRVQVEQAGERTVVSVQPHAAAASASGARAVWYADQGASPAPLRALTLPFDTPEGGWRGALQVEGSDDLQHWRVLIARAPLLSLKQGEQTLELRRIELASAPRLRYLRLTSVQGTPPPGLNQALAEYQAADAEPELRWLAVTGTGFSERPGVWRFDFGARLVLRRLWLQWPQPNTITLATLDAREHPGGGTRRIHHDWLYRLQQDGAEWRSEDIRLPVAAREILLHAPTAPAEAPILHAAYAPPRLLFAASGEPPWRLAWGHARAAATPRLPASVMQQIAPGAIGAALPGEAERNPAAQRAQEQAQDQREQRTGLLWLLLIAGVGLLAWMARQLARGTHHAG
jgi:hypothetical protein